MQVGIPRYASLGAVEKPYAYDGNANERRKRAPYRAPLSQRCHYMTRVGGREDPHPTCTCLILILHGLPSCYTSSYTCRSQQRLLPS
jgi:hypothetical protein